MSEDDTKKIRWPKKEHLIDALNAIDTFRDICRYQLDLGYWMTVSFPSKHHLNKILSTQYIDRDVMIKSYGLGLTDRLAAAIPICKSYLAFLKEDNVKKDKD